MSLELPDLPGAACASTDPELFHPESAHNFNLAAKAICHGCPEREPCLAYALANPVDGIWGGTTVGDRLRMGARPTSSTRTTGRTETCSRGHVIADDVYISRRGDGRVMRTCNQCRRVRRGQAAA